MTTMVIAPTAWHAAAFVGGALLKWAAAGRSTVLVVPDTDAGPIVDVARLLGADPRPIPWSEDAWIGDEIGRFALTDVIRETTPDLIVAPPVAASDARAAALGSMTFDAAFCSTVPHFRTPAGTQAGGTRMPIIEFDDPYRVVRAPIEYVDTTNEWDDKQRAIVASVDGNAGPFGDNDPVAVAETVSRARGLQFQSPHGEAYTQVRVYGRLRPVRLMP